MRRLLAIVLATVSLGSAASAQEAEVAADVQCLAVALGALSQAEEALKPALLLSAFYYFGRVDGRSIPDLERRLIQEIERLDEAANRAALIRCGGQLQARGQAMEAMGRNLQERATAAAAAEQARRMR
jgi:hypothetical protein